jgi:hypothetical protein
MIGKSTIGKSTKSTIGKPLFKSRSNVSPFPRTACGRHAARCLGGGKECDMFMN